jgi:mono/diheme cytochrome c family protein
MLSRLILTISTRSARRTAQRFFASHDVNHLRHRPTRAVLNVVWLSLVLVAAGCGGLSSEPNIVSTAPVPTVTATVPADIGHPISRVDLTDGAILFNGPQGCQNCHGTAGHGDGQTAASFSCKIPDAADPAIARSIAPSDWFNTTTNGNGADQTCLMPPWKNTLDEQQRWNVTSYLYSLHYGTAMLTTGAQIWADNCVACHGVSGKGDGPKAGESARPVPNFSDPAYLVSYSDTTLFNSVTNGVGSAMPAFASKLDDNGRWAVVAYLRSLTWTGATRASSVTATPAATAAGTAQPEAPTITVSGKVTNGTKAGILPPNLAVTLRLLDTTSSPPKTSATFQAAAAADGTYSFKDVPRQIGQAYVVTANYAGLQQFSTPIRLTAGAGPLLNLPLTIYEGSTDSADLVITQETMIVDFQDGSNAVVNVGINIANVGTHIYQSTQTDSTGAKLSIRLPLPAAATQVTVDPQVTSPFNVVKGADGITELQNTLPLFPGESRPVQFSYRLPVTGSLTLSLAVPYTTQAFSLYLPQSSGFAVADAHWPSDSPIALQNASGTSVTYLGYKLANPVTPGTVLALTIAPQTQLANADADARRNTLTVVLVLAGGAFLLIGLISVRLNRSERRQQATAPSAPPVTPTERLIAQIAVLDDRFEAGEIPQADYETQRAQLKAQLVALIAQS